jgi:hypothetical protein
VSDLYIFSIGPRIFLQQKRQRIVHGNINCSQRSECGNWECGRAIPFLGIFVSNFRYCFFAVWENSSSGPGTGYGALGKISPWLLQKLIPNSGSGSV